jgi:hypothetical protein
MRILASYLRNSSEIMLPLPSPGDTTAEKIAGEDTTTTLFESQH